MRGCTTRLAAMLVALCACAPTPALAALLGQRCVGDADCQPDVAGDARCLRGRCECAPFHAQFNQSLCLQGAMLGFGCLLDQQCSLKVANSACVDGSCACDAAFLKFRRHTCLKPARPGDVCYSDAHCRLWDGASHCRFLIRDLLGRCACSAGFRRAAACRPQGAGAAGGAAGGAAVITKRPAPAHLDLVITSRPVHAVTAARPPVTSSMASSMTPFYENSLPEAFHLQPAFRPDAPPPGVGVGVGVGVVEAATPPDDYDVVDEEAGVATPATSRPTPVKESVFLGQLAAAAAAAGVETTTAAASRWTLLSSEDPLPTTEGAELGAASTAATAAPSTSAQRAVSLGLRCAADAECRAADAGALCVDGLCDCAMRGNGTDACHAGHRGCHPSTFQCVSTGACISWFFVCDGRRDCADGSDERCDDARSGCPREALRCGDGSCVSHAAICDGAADCATGRDEAGCADRAQPACPAHAFRCADGSCLPGYEFCNAIVSCADASDEPADVCTGAGAASGAAAAGAASGAAADCPFRCTNGRCRSTAIVCSGRDGCGDASDEQDCAVCKCPAEPL